MLRTIQVQIVQSKCSELKALHKIMANQGDKYTVFVHQK